MLKSGRSPRPSPSPSLCQIPRAMGFAARMEKWPWGARAPGPQRPLLGRQKRALPQSGLNPSRIRGHTRVTTILLTRSLRREGEIQERVQGWWVSFLSPESNPFPCPPDILVYDPINIFSFFLRKPECGLDFLSLITKPSDMLVSVQSLGD